MTARLPPRSQLFKFAHKRAIDKGQTVFEEGDQDDAIYLLYLGKIELVSVAPPTSMTVYPGVRLACPYPASFSLSRMLNANPATHWMPVYPIWLDAILMRRPIRLHPIPCDPVRPHTTPHDPSRPLTTPHDPTRPHATPRDPP